MVIAVIGIGSNSCAYMSLCIHRAQHDCCGYLCSNNSGYSTVVKPVAEDRSATVLHIASDVQ